MFKPGDKVTWFKSAKHTWVENERVPAEVIRLGAKRVLIRHAEGESWVDRASIERTPQN